MSKHKYPRLNTRNWEDLTELDDVALPAVEKLRHHVHKEPEAASERKPLRPLQNFHRSRPD
jgi:hypothetical protein